MINYGQDIACIRRMLSSYSARYAGIVASAERHRKKSDKLTALMDVLDVMMNEMPIAVCGTDATVNDRTRGRRLRLFNGEYYYPIWAEDLMHEMDRWLVGLGFDNSTIVAYRYRLHDEIMYLVGRNVLQPRTTLMCFENGVVDFADYPIRLQPFDESHDVIKQYGFRFDMRAIADCPVWMSFIGDVQERQGGMISVLPEKWKRSALQMFLGALLIDRTRISFEHFMILQGAGSNGKSVINRVVKDIFGEDEVSEMQLYQLGKTGDEGLRAAAALDGKRLVYCPEESGSIKDLSFIKSISSGESVSIRRLGQDIKSMENPPMLMMNTNREWSFDDFLDNSRRGDISLFRRVVLLPFERVIPKDRRDTELWARLRSERAGIFAWIVKGMIMLRKNKYRIPDNRDTIISVTKENAKGRVKIKDKNVTGSVILYLQSKHLSPSNKEWRRHEVKTRLLYDNYVKFCEENGLNPTNMNTFSHDLPNLGFEHRTKVKLTEYSSDYSSHTTVWWDSMAETEVMLRTVPKMEVDMSGYFLGEDVTYSEFLSEFGLTPIDIRQVIERMELSYGKIVDE